MASVDGFSFKLVEMMCQDLQIQTFCSTSCKWPDTESMCVGHSGAQTRWGLPARSSQAPEPPSLLVCSAWTPARPWLALCVQDEEEADPEPAPLESTVGGRADTSQAATVQGGGCCAREAVGAQECPTESRGELGEQQGCLSLPAVTYSHL